MTIFGCAFWEAGAAGGSARSVAKRFGIGISTAAVPLLEPVSNVRLIHGNKGYDINAVRRQSEGKSAAPNMPPKARRVWKNGCSPVLHRTRNTIERMFNRLTDFRRIVTR